MKSGAEIPMPKLPAFSCLKCKNFFKKLFSTERFHRNMRVFQKIASSGKILTLMHSSVSLAILAIAVYLQVMTRNNKILIPKLRNKLIHRAIIH